MAFDEWGNDYGWCNSCGEEALMDTECCEDGEVVPYETDAEELREAHYIQDHADEYNRGA